MATRTSGSSLARTISPTSNPRSRARKTNLNLVTASGTVYSFLLTEGKDVPDLKLYVVPRVAGVECRREEGYTAAEVESTRKAADDAKKALDEMKSSVERTIDERTAAFRANYPAQLQFPYHFKADQPPFEVSAIYTDGTFTFIRANTSELPALYEVRDGNPNLVNFQVERGVYIVPKVLDRGYLAIGKQRLSFEKVR